MTVESTGFRFYTRTRSEDYRVFADEGRELRNKNDFLRLRKIAGCRNDDDEGAAVFAEGEMIQLVAFGFMRGDLDRGNRRKRFSFCRVYPKSQAGAALNALARIAEDWDGTAEFADSLIEEVPVMRKTEFEDFKGREKRSEDVRFDCVRFLQWLDTPAVNPIPPSYASALRAGNMLKYSSGEIFPVPMGTEIEEGDDDLPGRGNIKKESKPGKLPAILAVMLAVLCAVLGVWGWKQFQESSRLSQDLRTEQQKVSELRSELASRDNEISGLTKSSPDKNMESQETTSKKNEEAINVEITGNIIDNMCVHYNHDNHDNIVNTYNTMGSNIMGSSISFNHAASSAVAYNLVSIQEKERAEVSKKSSQSEKA